MLNLIDTNEAAKIVKLSPGWLRHLRSSGKTSPIPYYKIRGRVYYAMADLDAFLERAKVVSQSVA